MSRLLLLTNSRKSSAEVLPALALLMHEVRVASAEAQALLDLPPVDAILVDTRHDLAHARALTRLIRTTGVSVPVLAVVTEGGLAVVRHDWGFDDMVVQTAGPAEVDARLRLLSERLQAEAEDPDACPEIVAGELVIDEGSYAARLRGRTLHLTYKEFELLKYLAQHSGRVFTRAQLLHEVWGYDYFGGTRTIDVHVRRLRAKLGAEHEHLIGTVRNVGYRFTPPASASRSRERERDTALPTHSR